jgi:hypothetical protein
MSQIDTVFQSIPAPLLKDWGQTITYIKTSTPRNYDPTTGSSDWSRHQRDGQRRHHPR